MVTLRQPILRDGHPQADSENDHGWSPRKLILRMSLRKPILRMVTDQETDSEDGHPQEADSEGWSRMVTLRKPTLRDCHPQEADSEGCHEMVTDGYPQVADSHPQEADSEGLPSGSRF
jgi:hypothetical protein